MKAYKPRIQRPQLPSCPAEAVALLNPKEWTSDAIEDLAAGRAKLIPLAEGWTMVSARHFDRLIIYNWSRNARGYARRRNRTKPYIPELILMHREILVGPISMFCDHINHCLLDNRDCNLRNVTCAQNAWNRKVMRNNSTGFKGVARYNRYGKTQYLARVKVYGKDHYVGLFTTPQEAHIAYQSAVKSLHGAFAYCPNRTC